MSGAGTGAVAGGVRYLQVCEDEDEEPIELPCEEDGSVLLSTVAAQFYGCCGLKYRPAGSSALRGLRLAAERLYPPEESGWGDRKYVCVFPRRRRDAEAEAERERPAAKPRCSDLIVLGLPWKTDEDAVREYFRAFGDLLLVQIKRDPKTGSSKGFGFVKFRDYEAQIVALGQRHLIDGRWCDVRVPNSKEGLAPRVPSKVFVGRCTESITADDLREYFAKFGQVTDVFVPKPFRAFGFVTFLDPEVAQSLCGEDHIVKGVSVNVSNASPKREQREHRRARPRGEPGASGGPRRGERWAGRADDAVRAPSDGGGRPAGVGLPLSVASIPVNNALVAAALNRAGWGLVNGAPVDGYRGPPAQPGPASHQHQHQRAGYLNWVPQGGGGGDAQQTRWPHRQDVESYVKYE